MKFKSRQRIIRKRVQERNVPAKNDFKARGPSRKTRKERVSQGLAMKKFCRKNTVLVLSRKKEVGRECTLEGRRGGRKRRRKKSFKQPEHRWAEERMRARGGPFLRGVGARGIGLKEDVQRASGVTGKKNRKERIRGVRRTKKDRKNVNRKGNLFEKKRLIEPSQRFIRTRKNLQPTKLTCSKKRRNLCRNVVKRRQKKISGGGRLFGHERREVAPAVSSKSLNQGCA